MPKVSVDAAGRVLRPRLEDRLADEARFFKTWFDSPVLTGAVSPSGRFLARMMARAVDPNGRGPIVELGAGTGPITQALLGRGVDPRRLLLVEYDGAFCRLLRERFPGVKVVQADAYALRQSLAGVLAEPAAAVVSSLPLLNKPDRKRSSLLEDAFAAMAPGGAFVQFTYGLASPIPPMPAVTAEVSPPVWLNLPPARVWIYRRALSDEAVPGRPSAEDTLAGGVAGEGVPFRPARFRRVQGDRNGLFRRHPAMRPSARP